MDPLIRRAVTAYYITGTGTASPEKSRIEADGPTRHVIVCDPDGNPLAVYRVDKVPGGGEQLRSLRTVPKRFR